MIKFGSEHFIIKFGSEHFVTNNISFESRVNKEIVDYCASTFMGEFSIADKFLCGSSIHSVSIDRGNNRKNMVVNILSEDGKITPFVFCFYESKDHSLLRSRTSISEEISRNIALNMGDEPFFQKMRERVYLASSSGLSTQQFFA